MKRAGFRSALAEVTGEINVVADPHRFGTHAVQWQMDAAGDGREYYMIQWGVDATQLVPEQTYELTGYYTFDHTGDIAFDLTIPLGVAPTSYEFYLHSIKHTGQPARMTVDGVSLHPKP